MDDGFFRQRGIAERRSVLMKMPMIGGQENLHSEVERMRALAVQSDRRLKSLPDVPSVKELGIHAEYYGWVGVSVPFKTPGPIVEKLRDIVKKVAADKAYIEMIEKLGDDVRFKVGDDLNKFWDDESEMVAELFKTLVREEKK